MLGDSQPAPLPKASRPVPPSAGRLLHHGFTVASGRILSGALLLLLVIVLPSLILLIPVAFRAGRGSVIAVPSLFLLLACFLWFKNGRRLIAPPPDPDPGTVAYPELTGLDRQARIDAIQSFGARPFAEWQTWVAVAAGVLFTLTAWRFGIWLDQSGRAPFHDYAEALQLRFYTGACPLLAGMIALLGFALYYVRRLRPHLQAYARSRQGISPLRPSA